jgi:hypothetical protein
MLKFDQKTFHPYSMMCQIKKFVSLTHLMKPVNKRGSPTPYKYAQDLVHKQCGIIHQHPPLRVG